jgi:hypothetical protein
MNRTLHCSCTAECEIGVVFFLHTTFPTQLAAHDYALYLDHMMYLFDIMLSPLTPKIAMH